MHYTERVKSEQRSMLKADIWYLKENSIELSFSETPCCTDITPTVLQTCYQWCESLLRISCQYEPSAHQHITLGVNEVVFELIMEKTTDRVLRALYNSTDADGANSLKTVVACLD